MKITINLRDYILDAADGDHMLTATTSFSVDELFDGNAIEEEHEFDIDIDAALEENRQIAHIWAIEDVQQLRPDLDDEQAWQVLRTTRDRLDFACGITWAILELHAKELFGLKPTQRWQGRIDVAVEGYDRDEAIEHFTDLAAHIEKDAVNNTTRAMFDPASLRCADPNKNREAEEEQP